MKRPGVRGLAAALFLALAAPGCATVPTSGPVATVSSRPGRVNQGVEIAPAPPVRDASPVEVVDGFLHAMAAWQPGYMVARAYLSESAAVAWDPGDGVRVYAEGYPISVSEAGVRLAAPVVGRVDADGAYRQSSDRLEHDFGLVRDAEGQWRIGNPPEGLVISAYLFGSAFARSTVHFFAPGQDWLVPETRFFPRGQELVGAARAVTLGPTEWLAPAVEPTPAGASVRTAELTSTGVARVIVERPEGALGEDVEERLAIQLVWTLRQFDNVTGVMIEYSDGTVWDLGDFEGRVLPLNAFPEADPQERLTSRQLFAVADGRLVRVIESSRGIEQVAVAPASTDVAFAAVRSDALRAAIIPGARDALDSVALALPDTEALARAPALLRPHYSRLGEVWVPTGEGRILVAVDDAVQDVEVDGLDGIVTALRLAPDAVRAALIARRPDGRQVVGTARVLRSEGVVRLEGWTELGLDGVLGEGRQALDVGWRSTDTLLVLAEDAGGSLVLSVTQDGSGVDAVGPTSVRDLVELAVAPGVAPVVRTPEGDVYRYYSDFRWSPFLTGVSGVVYPG